MQAKFPGKQCVCAANRKILNALLELTRYEAALGEASKASAAPAQSTTFLPSLMMGGYWSGSEEEGGMAALERTADMGER